MAAGSGRSLRRVDGFQVPVVALTTLAAAMHGGAVAQACNDVAAAWSQAITTLADGMRHHSTALTDSAHTYRRVDANDAAALTPGR